MKCLPPVIFLAAAAMSMASDAPVAHQEASAPAAPADLTLDALAKSAEGLESSVRVSESGDVVTSPADLYRRAPKERIAIDDQPLAAVLKGLAKESQISFDISDDIPKRTVSVYYTLPPFVALEKLVQRYGAEMTDEDGIYHIRKLQPDALVMESYKLSHITLGSSSAASGSQTFGDGFEGVNSGGMEGGYGANGSGGVNGSRSGRGTASGIGSTGRRMGASGSEEDSSESSSPLRQSGNNVLINIRSLLALQSSNSVEVNDGVAPAETIANPNANAKAGANQVTLRGAIDYSAASNTLTIVATREQHRWVKQYLKAVDVPMSQIGLDVLFVESDVNPAESFGVDWSNTLSQGFRMMGGDKTDGMEWGTLGLPALPSGASISSDVVQASIRAWVTSRMARISQRPTIVTKPDQDVSFETTKKVPTISGASTTATASASAAVVGEGNPGQGSSSTLQTNFDADEQKIGTILRLRAVPIRKDLISVTVWLEISSPDSSRTGGELLTGRVATTSTSYQGVFDVEVGKTLAIGGLERVVEESGIGKVPGLGAIPFFGHIFKHKEKSLAKTHLTIFVTPSMINAALDATGSTATSHEANQRQLDATRGMNERAAQAEKNLERE